MSHRPISRLHELSPDDGTCQAAPAGFWRTDCQVADARVSTAVASIGVILFDKYVDVALAVVFSPLDRDISTVLLGDDEDWIASVILIMEVVCRTKMHPDRGRKAF
jgi:hypothetical protein